MQNNLNKIDKLSTKNHGESEKADTSTPNSIQAESGIHSGA